MSEYYVRTEKLTVGYDGVPLIENVEIGVEKGEILTLIGPNGSGKSTILKSIISQLRLIAGTVYIDGRDMSGMREREIARKMSIVMTERIRVDLMTCREIAETGRYPYTGRLGILSDDDRRIVDEAISLVHAQDYADKSFSQISDGQRQRILLARAICQQPDVIVLDEPTSFLDIKHKIEMLDILKKLVRERNIAVIMSLHELDLAEKVSDRIVCVGENRILRCDTPDKVFTDDYIRELYGIEKGSYNSLFGCIEMEKPCGTPRVFVIGGAGTGIPVYRLLQRNNVPFAAGVLSENDIDYPVARALAAEIISVSPYAPIRDCDIDRAVSIMNTCDAVVCTLPQFGEYNGMNKRLYDAAAVKLKTDDLPDFLGRYKA